MHILAVLTMTGDLGGEGLGDSVAFTNAFDLILETSVWLLLLLSIIAGSSSRRTIGGVSVK